MKSKRASGASSTSEPPRDSTVFFVDRCLGLRTVPDALQSAGFRVERHDDHYPPWMTDAEWLPEVGRQGWVILTKDKRLDKNQIELRALYNSGTPSFVLTGGSMTGEEAAAAFITAMPTVFRFLTKFHRPFVARVTASGTVRMYLTASGLIEKL